MISIEKYYFTKLRKLLLPELRELKASYFIVFRDILLGFLFILFALVISSQIFVNPNYNLIFKLVTLLLCSTVIGFFIANLTLFIHEAAHYNIHKDKRINDYLANIFLCYFTFQSIDNYRRSHLEHHRNHGTIKDTENSYFNHPSLLFLLKTIFLYRPIKVAFSKIFVNNKTVNQTLNLYIIYSIAINIIILYLCFLLGGFFLTASWILGYLSFFPLFASIRQIIEHRNPSNDKFTDYNKNDHGAYTIYFKNTLFSYFFGAAGFRSHLVHHLEPSISYTRFNDVEKILSQNLPDEYREEFKLRETTYFKAFLKLI
tara:strand:- start:1200 stop:2144 length:945 start_codon:yes stop_codon:yes gene_type:complete